MRTCPKCGSYIPDGKIFCVSCGRPMIAPSGDARKTTQHERKQNYERIRDAFEQTELKGFFRRDNVNPYHGNTYEQHKSHDPNSPDYYRSKFEKSIPQPKKDTRSAQDKAVEAELMTENILCVFAYIGCFFFVPLLLKPNSLYARFHANQGLVLFVFSILMGVFTSITGLSVLGILPLYFMGYGISNAIQGKTIELPYIGRLQLLPDNRGRHGGMR